MLAWHIEGRLSGKQTGQVGERAVGFVDWAGCHPGCKIGRLGVRPRRAHILYVSGVNGNQQEKLGLRTSAMQYCYDNHAPEDSLTEGPSARQR